MSYCRWSSDNWKSDVYVYEGDGWIIHVARRRRLFSPIPELPIAIIYAAGGVLEHGTMEIRYPTRAHRALGWLLGKLWMASHNLSMFSLKLIPLVKIKSPHAGETYSFDNPIQCAAMLLELKREGLHVPWRAIDTLIEDGISG